MTHKFRHDFAQKILGRMNGHVLAAGQQQLGNTGRTITEIVEQDPGQVSEVWCRKILRQLLEFLERQYAMRLPHRIITPDTVFVRASGEPVLLASKSDPRPDLARDLTALARVIHFAITRERVPTRPLRGRPLAGYSNSIIAAVDRSLDPDPDARPHTIEELRALLGIVGQQDIVRVHSMTRAPAQPSDMPASKLFSRPFSGLFFPLFSLHGHRPVHHRWPQWLIPAGAAIMLGVFLGILGASGGIPSFADLGRFRHPIPERSHAGSSEEGVRLPSSPLPGRSSSSVANETEEAFASNAPPVPAQEPEVVALPEPTDASNTPKVSKPGGNAGNKIEVKPSQQGSTASPAPPPRQSFVAADSTRTVHDLPLAVPKPITGDAILELRIQPWGVLFVDGVDRGLSPPLKRLSLSPGRHSVLVKNPHSGTRAFQVDTGQGDSVIAVDFNDQLK